MFRMTSDGHAVSLPFLLLYFFDWFYNLLIFIEQELIMLHIALIRLRSVFSFSNKKNLHCDSINDTNSVL